MENIPLPTRQEVIEAGMQFYNYVYVAITIVSAIVIIMIVSHLIPKKEY